MLDLLPAAICGPKPQAYHMCKSSTNAVYFRAIRSILVVAFAAVSTIFGTTAVAEVVIDMPAPPRKVVMMIQSNPSLPSEQPGDDNDAAAYPVDATSDWDTGDLALRRYCYGRTAPYDTYFMGSRFAYQSGWWGWGFWPWWGCSVNSSCIKPTSSMKCSVKACPG
jgi:hypothetical protein